ncbi:MAG TPA: hypothetical protein VF765_37580 [Polyangiaceae bacterium]
MQVAGKLIDKALEEVRLRPDQTSQVESMKAEAEKRHAPVKAAENRLAMAVADQIERGELDRCALAPDIQAFGAAVADARTDDRADFEKLHTLLDPTQRAAFAAALERQWDSIQKMHEPSALADKMARDLTLSDDQKTSLEKILTGLREVREAEPSYAAHRERRAKILDNFKGDRSVFDGLAPEKDVAAHTAAKVEQRIWAGEAILPVLNQDQRKAVADKIRAWAKGTSSSEEE